MPAVLFDIDGTLVTFKFDARGTRKALIEELTRSGLDASALDLDSPTQKIIDAARAQALSGRAGVEFEVLKKRMYSILDDFEEESSRQATVFPGAKETLIFLRSRSVRLAVLTNSGRKAAYSALRKAELTDCFDFVLTREDVGTMKPSPDGILEAVNRFSMPKSEICYVGDGVYDIVAAKAAGLRVISVATGIYTPERLRDEGADVVISSLKELPALLAVR